MDAKGNFDQEDLFTPETQAPDSQEVKPDVADTELMKQLTDQGVISADCWKSLLHDESSEPSSGKLLSEILQHQHIESVAIHRDHLHAANTFGELFTLSPVVLPVSPPKVAIHCEMVLDGDHCYSARASVMPTRLSVFQSGERLALQQTKASVWMMFADEGIKSLTPAQWVQMMSTLGSSDPTLCAEIRNLPAVEGEVSVEVFLDMLYGK